MKTVRRLLRSAALVFLVPVGTVAGLILLALECVIIAVHLVGALLLRLRAIELGCAVHAITTPLLEAFIDIADAARELRERRPTRDGRRVGLP